MYFINALKKLGMQFLNSKEKEVNKMKTKIIALAVTVAVTLLYTVTPAMAYTLIGTNAVSVSASGVLQGSTITFSGSVVDQSSGSNPSSSISFGTITTIPTDLTNSGRAIKVTGGTNEAGARIIILTDNANNTASPNKAPTVNPDSGVDGAGLVGQSDPGYTVPLMWGMKSAADNDPNSNIDYTSYFTKSNLNSGLHCVYIVDKRHTKSFCQNQTTDPLDTALMYRSDGSPVSNPAKEGSKQELMYPQFFGNDGTTDYDLYDSATAPKTVISQSLYKNIATLAFGIGPGGSGNYVCSVPKLSTSAYDDNVQASLGKIGTTGTDQYLYIYIAADFTTVPAQTYSTAKLIVEMVKG